MFKKILIANRGEIACRVIKTARRMGIATVAVYSEADAEAPHVGMADEAAAIGPAPAAESYLRIERIIEACKKTGAEAVHPGYGFLSERAEFAAALEKAGIVFIGPSVQAIAAMGDKIAAKKLAHKAGVATVPGHLGTITDKRRAGAVARDIGYPVMIKAAAGGGGKGMRIARDDGELRDGLRGAQSEARSSFGDDRVFLEKYIEEPRHIEIQVLGDQHGTVIHLGERECSIQRRHQKIVEEAPSPFLNTATRAAMGAQAVALARAVSYASAGTVEFIVDRERRFYFLEMNTRLQVEHPVTELTTGLDLVELQLRIAAGERLPFGQEDVRQKGWAIEARVYAEDPTRNFLPSIGRLVRYRPPVDQDGGGGIRIDSGVVEGSEISLYYDPLIAKLVAHGADRNQAITRLQGALDGFYIAGLRHNLAFLGAILGSDRFRQGALSTDFIAEEFPRGFAAPADFVAADRIILTAAALAEVCLQEREIGAHPLTLPSPPLGERVEKGGRGAAEAYLDPRIKSGEGEGDAELRTHRRRILLDKTAHDVTLRRENSEYVIERDGESVVAAIDWRPGEPLLHLRRDGRVATVQIERLRGRAFRLVHGGVVRRVQVLEPRTAELLAMMPAKQPADTSRLVLSPMPGLLTQLVVSEGQEVKAGEPLVIVEAMKMENVLRAERDGRVARLRVKPGDSLAVDQVILDFE